MIKQKMEDKNSAIIQLCHHCIHLFCSLYEPETCLSCCQAHFSGVCEVDLVFNRKFQVQGLDMFVSWHLMNSEFIL